MPRCSPHEHFGFVSTQSNAEGPFAHILETYRNVKVTDFMVPLVSTR